MASQPPPDLLTDRVVAAIGDRYEIEGELGRGGMAVVYRARDVRLRRPVALKVLPPDLAFRDGVRARFLREAETAAQLSHPNIVPIYAADETAGVAWLAMALIEGETLGARMARGPRLTIAETRRILAEVTDGLAYAHARGVVHRDVKPDNILLDRDSGRAMVTDFGIARAAEADQRLTVTGIAVGTPTYMSPEQALGESAVDGRSDLYSLGVVGYQMLTGSPPFTATSAAALLMKHVGELPRPVVEVRPDVPASLAAAINRVLAKKPDQRYENGAAFRAAVLEEEPRPLPPAPRPIPAASVPFSPPAPAAVREEETDWRAELRERRKEWRARDREQRDARREYERGLKDVARGSNVRGGLPVPMPPPPVPVPPVAAWTQPPPNPHYALPSLEDRAERFRRKTLGSAVLIAFLFMINMGTVAASGVPFPWFIFPAFAMLGGVRRRWRRDLAREGVSFWGLMFGGAEQAVADAQGHQARGLDRLEAVVKKFRSRVTLAVGAAIAACISFVIGASLNAEPMLVPFVGFVILSLMGLQGAIFAGARARRAGIPLGAALGSRWKEAVVRADPRSRDVVAEDDARRLADPSVLAGPYGRVVRGAVDDRLAVRETLAKLSPADRALLPEITPTIDGLVARIAELAQSLHRLDTDVSPDQLAQLEARLQAVSRESPDAPDRERKRQLLERQRTSLAELLEKRSALAGQLESAQLVLQNLRLDLVKLRSQGVGAALGQVSTATQEARALSRDIRYALEAAAEVRGM